MKTSNKYKFLLGFGYILILSVFLYFIFSNFTFQEIGNYNFIKDNREFFEIEYPYILEMVRECINDFILKEYLEVKLSPKDEKKITRLNPRLFLGLQIR